MHMVRSDDPLFAGFGEIYFSITNPGVVKGWHRHEEQSNLFSCISGTLMLALYDGRETSPTFGDVQTIVFGDEAHKVVRIPAGVIYSWKNIGSTPALLANLASHPHDPAKSTRFPIDSPDIPHRWGE